MVGEELAFVVQVKDPGELPAETAGEAVAVEPQPDEVAVQPNDAVELVALVPIDGDRVAEIISLEESWPWKSMGMPGAVNTSPQPRSSASGSTSPSAPRFTSCGTRALPFATSSCDSL